MAFTAVIPPVGVALNPLDCNLDFVLSGNNLIGSTFTTGGFAFLWSGARAVAGICGGRYYFKIKVLEYINVSGPHRDEFEQKHACRVGVSVLNTDVALLGEVPSSWSFASNAKVSTSGQNLQRDYGVPFGLGDEVCCFVDLLSEPGTISFSVNGKLLGVAFSIPRYRTMQDALFPHVLLKNVSVQVDFAGLPSPPSSKLPFGLPGGLVNGFTPWRLCVLDQGRFAVAPHTNQMLTFSQCEVLCLVGLPGSGKTTWAQKLVALNPAKRYLILGINSIMNQIKVAGPAQQASPALKAEMQNIASEVLNKVLERAAYLPRNYVIDNTNLYDAPRKRLLSKFRDQGFKVKAAVFVLPNEMLFERQRKQHLEEKKTVPEETIADMKANFSLPRIGPDFAEVLYVEAKPPEAEAIVNQQRLSAQAVLPMLRKRPAEEVGAALNLPGIANGPVPAMPPPGMPPSQRPKVADVPGPRPPALQSRPPPGAIPPPSGVPAPARPPGRPPVLPPPGMPGPMPVGALFTPPPLTLPPPTNFGPGPTPARPPTRPAGAKPPPAKPPPGGQPPSKPPPGMQHMVPAKDSGSKSGMHYMIMPAKGKSIASPAPPARPPGNPAPVGLGPVGAAPMLAPPAQGPRGPPFRPPGPRPPSVPPAEKPQVSTMPSWMTAPNAVGAPPSHHPGPRPTPPPARIPPPTGAPPAVSARPPPSVPAAAPPSGVPKPAAPPPAMAPQPGQQETGYSYDYGQAYGYMSGGQASADPSAAAPPAGAMPMGGAYAAPPAAAPTAYDATAYNQQMAGYYGSGYSAPAAAPAVTPATSSAPTPAAASSYDQQLQQYYAAYAAADKTYQQTGAAAQGYYTQQTEDAKTSSKPAAASTSQAMAYSSYYQGYPTSTDTAQAYGTQQQGQAQQAYSAATSQPYPATSAAAAYSQTYPTATSTAAYSQTYPATSAAVAYSQTYPVTSTAAYSQTYPATSTAAYSQTYPATSAAAAYDYSSYYGSYAATSAAPAAAPVQAQDQSQAAAVAAWYAAYGNYTAGTAAATGYEGYQQAGYGATATQDASGATAGTAATGTTAASYYAPPSAVPTQAAVATAPSTSTVQTATAAAVGAAMSSYYWDGTSWQYYPTQAATQGANTAAQTATDGATAAYYQSLGYSAPQPAASSAAAAYYYPTDGSTAYSYPPPQ